MTITATELDDRADTENVVLIPEYFPAGLLGNVGRIVTGLDAVIVPQFNPAAVVSGPGIAVNEARKRMSALLKSAAFTQVRDAMLGVENESLGVVGAMIRRQFGVVRAEVERIDDIRAGTGVSSLSEATIASALKTTQTEYTIDLPVGPPFTRFVAGYGGPTLTAAQRTALSEYSELVVGGTERAFRVSLLRAEYLLGLGDPEAALREYDKALAISGLSANRKRFAAVKAGYAQVAVADRTYRSSSRPTPNTRCAALVRYGAAVQVLDRHGVPTNDPDRGAITALATRARAQLQAGLNALGLMDSFVPVQRLSHLRDLARAQIGVLIDAAREFEADLQQAEDQLGVQFEVAAELAAEAITQQISALLVDNATLTEEQVAEKVAMIEAQRDFLTAETAITGSGQIIKAAAGIAAGSPDAGEILGLASMTVHFFAQRNELGHQLEMAKIEQDIAANQTAIAGLQRQQSAERTAYLERKASFLTGRRMNADFLFARAAIGERRVARHLEVCIVVAYLCERALAFFLGKPTVKHIRFDYIDTEPGVVAAARGLRSNFETMIAAEEAALDLEQSGGFVERLSLRQNYPLQFQRFLESDDGRMDFVYSLYQLSKNRPATHQCRLYHVGVEVKGLVPDGALRGTLTHSGRFLVRDRVSTLDAETIRLVPTDAELSAALQDQRDQGTAVAAVGGVLFYTLTDDVLDLSQASEFVPPPPPTFTLSTFEGHGPTGLWTLQVENHRSLDITDIVLHFGIVNRESDPGGLRTKVRQLLAAYEDELAEGNDLDRVGVFSMRQQFGDAYFALENGPANVELDQDLFDPGLGDLRFKAIVVQAIDQDRDGLPGIAVRLRRDDAGFVYQRTTGDGGFSENLDEPLAVLDLTDRFDLLGSWRIELADPSQFDQLDDLRLMFVYAHTRG